MKKSTFPLLATGTALILSLSGTPVFASTSTTPPISSRPNLQSLSTEELCERITERMETQQEKFEERLEKVQELHERHQARLEELKTNASELGVDVTELESMLETLNDYTAEIVSIRSQTRSEIEQGAAAICAGDRESSRDHFSTARGYVEQVKSIRQERRDYFVNTVVPELKSIRLELKAAQDANTDSDGAEA